MRRLQGCTVLSRFWVNLDSWAPVSLIYVNLHCLCMPCICIHVRMLCLSIVLVSCVVSRHSTCFLHICYACFVVNTSTLFNVTLCTAPRLLVDTLMHVQFCNFRGKTCTSVPFYVKRVYTYTCFSDVACEFACCDSCTCQLCQMYRQINVK